MAQGAFDQRYQLFLVAGKTARDIAGAQLQRELAERLGISLGRVNYCLKALAEKGAVKIRNLNTLNLLRSKET